MELTIRCVDQIKSLRLALIIGRIVCKILKACKSQFLNRVEAAGYGLAEKICKIAIAWKNVEASEWMRDSTFIRFLGVNAINGPLGWS